MPSALKAVTVKLWSPTVVPSVHSTFACPLLSVATSFDDTDAVLSLTVNVTLAPLNTLPSWSLTNTTTGLVRVLLTVSDCLSPETSSNVSAPGATPDATATSLNLPPVTSIVPTLKLYVPETLLPPSAVIVTDPVLAFVTVPF